MTTREELMMRWTELAVEIHNSALEEAAKVVDGSATIAELEQALNDDRWTWAQVAALRDRVAASIRKLKVT